MYPMQKSRKRHDGSILSDLANSPMKKPNVYFHGFNFLRNYEATFNNLTINDVINNPVMRSEVFGQQLNSQITMPMSADNRGAFEALFGQVIQNVYNGDPTVKGISVSTTTGVIDSNVNFFPDIVSDNIDTRDTAIKEMWNKLWATRMNSRDNQLGRFCIDKLTPIADNPTSQYVAHTKATILTNLTSAISQVFHERAYDNGRFPVNEVNDYTGLGDICQYLGIELILVRNDSINCKERFLNTLSFQGSIVTKMVTWREAIYYANPFAPIIFISSLTPEVYAQRLTALRTAYENYPATGDITGNAIYLANNTWYGANPEFDELGRPIAAVESATEMTEKMVDVYKTSKTESGKPYGLVSNVAVASGGAMTEPEVYEFSQMNNAIANEYFNETSPFAGRFRDGVAIG
jgi:hypothetical protein